MGGFTTGGFNVQQNPQQAAANQVKATPGSSPSLGQMQQGMGGLLTNETQQNAFSNFFGGLMDTFAPAFNSLINSGYQGTGQEPPVQDHLTPQQPTQPEQSAYEARIKALMDQRGWTREEAVANQQNALKLGTDYNNDGAVTNDEWAKYKQTPTGAQYAATHTGQPWRTPQPAPQGAPAQPAPQQSSLLMPDGIQRAQKNIKRLGGFFL